VLQGFSVNWSEDHHFKRLMLDLRDDRVAVTFHDNDRERIFEHLTYFAVLRDP
jgi:hypothetical protein